MSRIKNYMMEVEDFVNGHICSDVEDFVNGYICSDVDEIVEAVGVYFNSGEAKSYALRYITETMDDRIVMAM